MNPGKMRQVLHKLSVPDYVKNSYSDCDLPYSSRKINHDVVNRWKSEDFAKKKNVDKNAERLKRMTLSPEILGAERDSGYKFTPILWWPHCNWKTRFIFRGDNVPKDGLLFLEVEKVTLKKLAAQAHHQLKAATICILNEDSKIVFWAFVRIDDTKICQYTSKISSLDQFKLGLGISDEMVRWCLDKCLPGNTLVGCKVAKDLESLNYNHDKVIDLQEFIRDNDGPFAVGYIAQKWFHDNQEEFNEDQHSAVVNCCKTLAVYNRYMEIKESTFELNCAIQELSENRDEYVVKQPKYYDESCMCQLAMKLQL